MTTMERYNQLKTSYPGAIVLMRVGDFYETYDKDARKCNELCGLTLTLRPGWMLTGFPYHALEKYMPSLCVKGRPVITQEKDRWVKFWRDGKDKLNISEHMNHPYLINNQTTSTNNNQTTTTMEKKFAFINVNDIYWYNRDREALVKLVLVRQNFNLDLAKAKFEWAEADDEQQKVVLVTQYDPQEPDKLPTFYASPEDFEKGKVITELYWMRDEKDICLQLLEGQRCRRVQKDEKGAYIWAYIKGQAVKWYFNKHIDVVTFERVAPHDYKAKADADVPECYQDAEEVYQYNDWTEIREDGERVKHEGVYNRLRLEPDQEALAKKLQTVLDECKTAGMKVYFNLCDYNLHAVNVRKVERIEYDPSVDEDTERAYTFEDRVGHWFNGVYDLNTEDTGIMFVIKK